MKCLQGGGPDAQEGCWGNMEAPGKEPVTPGTPRPHSWDRRGTKLLLLALRGRAWAQAHPHPVGPRPRPSLAAVRPKPRVTLVFSSLCRRFAEQAVFILFCVFAILLFSRDPKFIPGWASLFTPG